ncbi:hypothetical protein QQ045_011996 [Rhodiola kirilowii]
MKCLTPTTIRTCLSLSLTQERSEKREGDVSVLNKKKKKSKTTLTTHGWEGVEKVLIALNAPTKVGPRQTPSSRVQSSKSATPLPPALEVPKATDGDGVNLAAKSATPLPVAADPNVGSATRSTTQYKVKPELAATAQYVLNKHGDVVAVTSLKGSLLTHLLENVCLIYKKLEESKFMDLTIEELEVMRIDLHDFRKLNVNIDWLLTRLEDILNGKKVLQTINQELMEAKDKLKRFLEKSLVDGI